MDKKCPDCSGALTKIKIFGRSIENPLTGSAIDTDLSFYTEADAERSGFRAMFKPQGRVETFLCNGCGRIFLFGAAD